MSFSTASIDALRENIRASMSERRFTHTAEVEKMAVRLAELYAPEKSDVLRVAALLHDVTKERSVDEHFEILKAHEVEISDLDRLSPKTLHARTAALVIKDEYSEFAIEEVVNAVLRHTTGDAEMTVVDMIVYLADYIDMSRSFPDCVFLREYFWNKEPQNMPQNERYSHLLQTLVLSFDLTLRALVEENSPISVQTVEARNAILCKLNG